MKTNTYENNEIASALLAEAQDTGRLERATAIAAKFHRLEKSSIPRRALVVAVSGRIERTEAIQLADQWAQRRRSGVLVLSGPVGTGKTVAAAWYACRARAEWASAPMIGLATHAQANSEIERLRRVESLVLDEVGGQGTTAGYATERIATLISQRHGDLRPTVITTNLDQIDFARVYDGVTDPGRSRIVDRIVEDGQWFTVGGQSRRSSAVDLESRKHVEAAKDLVRWCDHAEDVSLGVDADPKILDKLTAALGVDSVCLARRVESLRASRSRVDSMVRGLLSRVTAPNDPPLTEAASQDADAQRREELAAQVESVKAWR